MHNIILSPEFKAADLIGFDAHHENQQLDTALSKDALHIGNSMGNPGVFQSNPYPYPYPSKPVPASTDMGYLYVEYGLSGVPWGFLPTHGFGNGKYIIYTLLLV